MVGDKGNFVMKAESKSTSEILADFLGSKSSVPIVQIDQQQRITDCNYGFLKLFSLSQKPLETALADFLIAGSAGLVFEEGTQQFLCNPKTGVYGSLVASCLPHENGLLLWCDRPLSTDNQVVERMALLNNEYLAVQRRLTKQNFFLNQVKKELAEKVTQLESTLSYVKRLEGILPVCIYCKKIRDDTDRESGKGEWMQMEAFLSHKGGTSVSHGCCPKCFEKHIDD